MEEIGTEDWKDGCPLFQRFSLPFFPSSNPFHLFNQIRMVADHRRPIATPLMETDD
jgi:hypothetical protein